MPESLDLTQETPAQAPPAPPQERPVDLEQKREHTRGDLARGLLWLLAFSVGGVILFIGNKRIEGSVLTQSIFPSLIALAGTALGFYFGAQAAKGNEAAPQPPRGAVPPA